MSLQIDGDREVLVLLAKALTSKRGGATPSDRKHLTIVGDFCHKGTLEYDLTGKVGKDYEKDTYYGVGLDNMLNVLMAVIPGFVEDYMRKACHIALELRKAELEEREVQDSHWVDEKGTHHPLTAQEILDVKAKVEKRIEQAKETVAPFAKVIKTTRPAAGRVDLKDVTLKVN